MFVRMFRESSNVPKLRSAGLLHQCVDMADPLSSTDWYCNRQGAAEGRPIAKVLYFGHCPPIRNSNYRDPRSLDYNTRSTIVEMILEGQGSLACFYAFVVLLSAACIESQKRPGFARTRSVCNC